MKILMIGRGVISTLYGWALEKAGNEIEFYVRPGKTAVYGPVVNLDILDGREKSKGHRVIEQWPIKMRETFDENHTYDLIIISVNHYQLEEVAQSISPHTGNATILIFNNIWLDAKTIEHYFPSKTVLWGFPGGGGGYHDLNTLKGGFMKRIFLESEVTAASKKRHQQVVKLFKDAGFSVSQQKNMHHWLWGHFILNAAMAAEAIKVGGYLKAFQSRDSVTEMILLMREMIPLIKARKGNLDMITMFLVRMPIKLSAFLLQKSATSGTLTGEIMRRMEGSGHATTEMAFQYLQDIMKDSRKYDVKLPHLEALKPYFCESVINFMFFEQTISFLARIKIKAKEEIFYECYS
ncbi:ketopantoate reductase family protein [Defluviitalea saccharophila]|uniref:2-dehydropantoate 2-reductase N-terminal domain-containing protein n=1 Tax=Defluviitalea saccharophila TaxID=879970 RepID=A0ABZ2Y2S2_9FIRM